MTSPGQQAWLLGIIGIPISALLGSFSQHMYAFSALGVCADCVTHAV